MKLTRAPAWGTAASFGRPSSSRQEHRFVLLFHRRGYSRSIPSLRFVSYSLPPSSLPTADPLSFADRPSAPSSQTRTLSSSSRTSRPLRSLLATCRRGSRRVLSASSAKSSPSLPSATFWRRAWDPSRSESMSSLWRYIGLADFCRLAASPPTSLPPFALRSRRPPSLSLRPSPPSLLPSRRSLPLSLPLRTFSMRPGRFGASRTGWRRRERSMIRVRSSLLTSDEEDG